MLSVFRRVGASGEVEFLRFVGRGEDRRPVVVKDMRRASRFPALSRRDPPSPSNPHRPVRDGWTAVEVRA